MKHTVVFLFPLLIFKCQISIYKDFKIKISSSDKIISNGDNIKIIIESKSGQVIDSAAYYLNEKEVSSETTLKDLKLGVNSAKVKIYSNGIEHSLARSFDVYSNKKPDIMTYEIIREYNHDQNAYTQGLEFYGNSLYESTGLNGKSSLRKVDLNNGVILKVLNLEYEYFAEGLTILNDRIFQLTWRNKIGFIYDLDFNKIGSFDYNKSIEGWGLTNDGEYIYKSDGTSKIWRLDPDTLEEIDFIDVMTDKSRIRNINELEFIDGKIYANTYQQNRDVIIIINPKNGAVESVVDFTGIRNRVQNSPETDVMNGIAELNGRLFVTGKNWNKLFEVKIYNK
ncbi:MAG: glutaminyl-peptide cyclotransferase [Bacteroidota bacterium]|nr:glutaminyl-peptide cyclotransferase [Bacteroidota bacterium]